MVRLYIICEGQTEEEFVNNLLAHHLHGYGVHPIPLVIGTRGHQGGNVNYQRLRRNIRNTLLQEIACYCSVLIDYYGLPSDFPGKLESKSEITLPDVAEAFSTSLENASRNDIGENSIRRFVPYVQMHEFEALLFSDPARFAIGISRPDFHATFQRIRRGYVTPEHINDDPNTAPSKQVIDVFPGYERQKPLLGVLAALEIGLAKIRQECRLFDAWLAKLERLPPPPA